MDSVAHAVKSLDISRDGRIDTVIIDTTGDGKGDTVVAIPENQLVLQKMGSKDRNNIFKSADTLINILEELQGHASTSGSERIVVQ